MIPNIYLDKKKSYSHEWCKAFAAGCGGKIVTEYEPGPCAIYGSPRIWDQMMIAINAGETLYYGDHAYFGRGKYWRVTKNAFQHSGHGTPDFKRLKEFYKYPEPWKKSGRNILICTQTSAYYDRMGVPNWINETINTIRKNTKRPIIIRQKGVQKPLSMDFQNAFCVVCYSSNVAVEAIMNGIPAIATGQCAASIMSLSDPALVESPYYPDGRMEWAGTLAANQWTLEEIAAGQCWEKIQ